MLATVLIGLISSIKMSKIFDRIVGLFFTVIAQ